MDLSIVLPAWNEAENLRLLVPEIRSALTGVNAKYEIVVVDGGSRDGTGEVARGLGCRVVEQETPGYGGALREGFFAAAGSHICTLDADLSHPPTFIAEMWRRRDEAEVLIASRYVPGGSAEMPRTRAVLSRVLNRGFGELLDIPVADLSSGFRLYRRTALDPFETSGRNFNVLQELLTGILARGGRAVEVPFHYRPRGTGSSHARIVKFGLSYIGSLRHLLFLRTSLFTGEPAVRLLPYFLVILLAIGAVYAHTLGYGAVRWDDDWLVFENPALRSLSRDSLAAMFDPRAPREMYGSQYQPLSDLSYAIDGAIFGWEDHRRFHIQGIFWHALSAILLFTVVNRHARSAGIALTAALLFALHPVAVEPPTWIAGRRTAMAAAFMLLAALAWLRYRESGGRRALALSLAAAVLANLSKQGALALPVVLALIDLTACDGRGGLRPVALAVHAALAGAFAAVFYQVGVREGVVGPHPLGLEGQVKSALIALAYYARMTVYPAWLRPSYALVFEDSQAIRLTLAAGAAVLVAWLAAVALLWRRAPVAAFGLAAALVCLGPSLTGLGTQFVAERYLYLSLGFLAIAAAAGFARLARVGPPPSGPGLAAAEVALVRRRRRLSAALLAVLLALGTASFLRTRVWRDDVTLWADAAAKDPRNRIAHRLLGRALMRRAQGDDLVRAEAELRLAAGLESISPPLRGPSSLPTILRAVASLCEQRGAFDEAERTLYAALEAAPTSQPTLVQLGDFYRRRGDRAKARAVYDSAAGLDPKGRLAKERIAEMDAEGRRE